MTSKKRIDQVCPVCGRPLPTMEYDYIASPVPGVMTFPFENRNRILENETNFVRGKGPGLIPVLIGGAGKYLWGFFRGLLAPYRLMPGYLLGAAWLILSVLAVEKITFPLQEGITWLSFSMAGLNGGIFGAVGGIVGKGVFAGSLFRLISKDGKWEYRKWKGRWSFGAALAGVGLSWILFNFFTWDNSASNSVIGLLATLGLLKAMGNDKGYYSSLVRSFWRERDLRQGWSMGLGMAAGFLAAVPASFYAGAKTGYVFGLPLMILGLILGKSKLAQKIQDKYNYLILGLFVLFKVETVFAFDLAEWTGVSLSRVIIVGVLASLAAAAATATVFSSRANLQESEQEPGNEIGVYRLVLEKDFGDTIQKGNEHQYLRAWVEKQMEDGLWRICEVASSELAVYLSTTLPGLRLKMMECKEGDRGIGCLILLEKDWPGEHGVVAFNRETGGVTYQSRILFHLA